MTKIETSFASRHMSVLKHTLSHTSSVQVESVPPVKFLNELIKTLESQMKYVGYVDSRTETHHALAYCIL
jgi:hypothetical protein